MLILVILLLIPFFFSLDYASSGQEKTTSSSTRSKTKVGFLENLNAKLAEQRLSGKAFAVRNLINSKALVSVLHAYFDRYSTRWRIKMKKKNNFYIIVFIFVRSVFMSYKTNTHPHTYTPFSFVNNSRVPMLKVTFLFRQRPPQPR